MDTPGSMGFLSSAASSNQRCCIWDSVEVYGEASSSAAKRINDNFSCFTPNQAGCNFLIQNLRSDPLTEFFLGLAEEV